jgi:hypothetical protein
MASAPGRPVPTNATDRSGTCNCETSEERINRREENLAIANNTRAEEG